VIAQVKFSLIPSIDQPEFIGPFQEAIRETNPSLRQERMVVGPQGPAPVQEHVAWRFSDIEEEWRVSLAPEFLALETTAYTSRQDFLARLQAAIEALHVHIKPAALERLGLRYIDRVADDALEEITRLVQPEVLGILASPLADRASHSLCETLFDLPNDHEKLLARWGRIPVNGTVDPAAIEPLPQASWILDLDMFSNKRRMFLPDDIVADAERYAERLYTFFRWVVTDDFLARYGGTP